MVVAISVEEAILAADPYILHRYEVQPTCHLDKELLYELDFFVYSAKLVDEDGKVYIFTLLSMEIKKVHQYGLIPHHCHQTSIDRFFDLQPCGVDVKKVL